VKATKEGFVEKIKTVDIGKAAMVLGAGRSKKEDVIDLAVGVKVYKKVGDKVAVGDTLAEIYANDKNIEEAYKIISDAYILSTAKVEKHKIILDKVY